MVYVKLGEDFTINEIYSTKKIYITSTTRMCKHFIRISLKNWTMKYIINHFNNNNKLLALLINFLNSIFSQRILTLNCARVLHHVMYYISHDRMQVLLPIQAMWVRKSIKTLYFPLHAYNTYEMKKRNILNQEA